LTYDLVVLFTGANAEEKARAFVQSEPGDPLVIR
jgi:hypothetical protein